MSTIFYRIAIIIAIALAALTSHGQSKSYRIYDEYSRRDGFTYFSLNKNMLDVVNLTLDEENKKVTGDLDEIRVMIYNPEKGNFEGSFMKRLEEMLKKSNYDLVARDEDDDCDDSDVEFWIKGKRKKVYECHVVIGNPEETGFVFLVSFYGDMDVNDLEILEDISKSHVNL